MKTAKKIGLLLLAILLLIPFADVDAQKRKRKKKDETKSVSSFVDVYGGAGYSAFLHLRVQCNDSHLWQQAGYPFHQKGV